MASCAAYKINAREMPTSRRGGTNKAGNVAIYICRRVYGETLARIGREFHLGQFRKRDQLLVSEEEDTGGRDEAEKTSTEAGASIEKGSKPDLTLLPLLLLFSSSASEKAK